MKYFKIPLEMRINDCVACYNFLKNKKMKFRSKLVRKNLNITQPRIAHVFKLLAKMDIVKKEGDSQRYLYSTGVDISEDELRTLIEGENLLDLIDLSKKEDDSVVPWKETPFIVRDNKEYLVKKEYIEDKGDLCFLNKDRISELEEKYLSYKRTFLGQDNQ